MCNFVLDGSSREGLLLQSHIQRLYRHSIFKFPSVDVWAYKIEGFSRYKLDEGFRVPDSCPYVMVDGCKARGAHSEITSFAPAGRHTFHDSVASHICVWSMTCGHAQCTSRSVTHQAHPHSRELLPRRSGRVPHSASLTRKSFMSKALQMQALAMAISTVSHFFSS